MDFLTEQGAALPRACVQAWITERQTVLFLHVFLNEMQLGCMVLLEMWELDFHLALKGIPVRVGWVRAEQLRAQ